MKTVYMVRNQHAGVLTTHVFEQPPTEEQVAAMLPHAARVHASAADGWGMVHEAQLLGPDELPQPPAPPRRDPDGNFVGSGAGTVG